MPLTERQVPYTGPYGLAGSGLKEKGPTAEALKRAMSRLGLIDWTDFDPHYDQTLAAALAEWDPGNTGYGEGRCKKLRSARVPKGREHAGEYALDAYGQKLIQDEAGATDEGDDEAEVMRYIREFWRKAVQNRARWRYTQTRPFQVFVDPSGSYVRGDCSSTVVQAVAYAGGKAGVKVVDPSKQSFSGFGNTDLFEDDWPKIGAPYRVGDLAHFHSPRHVVQCIRPGNLWTAEWGSNGKEADPTSFVLANYSRFPGEFMFVVRPTLLAT